MLLIRLTNSCYHLSYVASYIFKKIMEKDSRDDLRGRNKLGRNDAYSSLYG